MKFELALSALLRSKKFTLVFVFNFALAILGIFSLQYFKGTMEKSLGTKARVLLGSDLVVSSKFPISNDQKKLITESIPKTENVFDGVSMMSMVSSSVRSRLTQVAMIENGFPYYGGMTFTDGSSYKKNGQESAPSENEIWIYPEVLNQHKSKIGDTLKIGKSKFVITKVIQEDSFKSLRFSGFIPRVYMSEAGIKRADILQYGSTVQYTQNFKFLKTYTNDELKDVETKLEKIMGKAIRVKSPNDGGDRIIRIMEYITNFLSLVSLVSFYLGLVGLFYLYSGFLEKNQKDMKVLLDLGVKKTEVLGTYLLHFLSMLLISCVLIFGLLSFASPLMKSIISSNVPIEVDYSLDIFFFLKALLLIFSLALSLGVPMILDKLNSSKKSFLKSIAGYLPLAMILIALSQYVASVKNIGLYFSLALFVIIGLVFIVGRFILNLFDRSGLGEKLDLSLAFKNILRRKNSTLTIFLALFISTSLFSLIPQVGASLSKALALSGDTKPRFFVLDAQESELPKIREEVETMGAQLQNIAPMIRARIVEVNGVDFRDFSKSKEKEVDEDENELKNRTVNLSYRKGLKESESIDEGRDFSGDYKSKDLKDPVEVSLEKGYAQRRGIKLNDKITFDVLGMEVKGIIVNLRTVDWAQFVPNFFFIFQNGAINEAPKTMLATISSGDYNADEMMINLSTLFPSLTIFDVKNVIDEFSKIVNVVTSVLDKMSLFSVFVGLIMTFIIIYHQMSIRRGDILRLKMIGLRIKNIRMSLLLEFAYISLSAVLLGVALGASSSYFIANYLFEGHWDFQLPIVLTFLTIVPALILFVVYFVSLKVTREKENDLFGEI